MTTDTGDFCVSSVRKTGAKFHKQDYPEDLIQVQDVRSKLGTCHHREL